MRQNLPMLQGRFLYCRFEVVVKINGVRYGTGVGKSKKEAKAAAAAKTWDMIEPKVSCMIYVFISSG